MTIVIYDVRINAFDYKGWKNIIAPLVKRFVCVRERERERERERGSDGWGGLSQLYLTCDILQ